MKKNSTLHLIFTIILFLFAFQAYSANISVSDSIASNTTWNYDTVKVNSDFLIPNGLTLTISSGTYIEFQGHYKLDVKGRLLALGEATNKITFTAVSQTVGWGGIRFENTLSTNDSSLIQYSIISYGKASSGTANDMSGGGIFMYDFSKLKIVNSIISNNSAANYGGGIALEYKASPIIINCLITNNSSTSTGGGVDIYSQSNPILINNTIVNNTSSSGGGIWYSSTGCLIRNCIIYGNTANGGSQIFGTPQNVSYCDIEGGFSGGSNNIDTIPGFVSSSAGAGVGYNGLTADFSLSQTSYLIDKGTNTVARNGFPNFDVIGKFRFDNKRIDIGAYEYISSTEV
jgi:parallel beta-helix repeat protein